VNLTLDKNDVFRYVVGNTSIHPIEALIDFDNRYEVMNFGVFDHSNSQLYTQDGTYTTACMSVDFLKSSVQNLSRDQIELECEKICIDSFNLVLDNEG
jgi:hypothetical protein